MMGRCMRHLNKRGIRYSALYTAKSDSQVRAISIVKPVLSGHSKEDTKICFQDQRLIIASYRSKVLQEHSPILLTCTKLPPVFEAFVLSIFEWPLKTGLTVFTVRE